MPKNYKYFVRAAWVLAAGFGALQAAELREAASFDIAAQALDTALLEFSQQAGVQVLATTDAVAGKRTEGVRGKYVVEDALTALLKRSGLGFRATGSHAVTIAAVQNKEVAQVSASPIVLAGSGSEEAGNPHKGPPTDSAESAAVLEEVVVTGTHIRGVPRISPVIVIDRDKIQKSSATSLPDLMRRVPQNLSSSVSELSDALGGVGEPVLNTTRSAAIDLRGLGSRATLTLLNGRRLAPTESGEFVDISSIPLSAIERVEILPEGASSIYGSDAVAGVVNIILRDHFEGAETGLSYGQVTNGGYDEWRASQTFGHAWSSGRAMVSYEHRRQGTLEAQERGLSRDATSGTSLLSPGQQDSVVLDASQDLNSALTLSGSVYGATGSKAYRGFLGGVVPDNTRSGSDSVAVNVGVRARLSHDWQWETEADYARNYSKTINEIPLFGSVLHFKGVSVIKSLDTKVDGPLADLPGGALKAAFGAGYRRSSTDAADVQTVTAGQLTFQDTLVVSDRSRNNPYAYAEFLLPLVGARQQIRAVHSLELDASARYDHYSDFGNSVNPKLALAWMPFEDLRLTASWGTSFRAPQLSQLSEPPQAVLDTIADPLSPTGSTVTLVEGGVAELKPEKADSWLMSASYNPVQAPKLQLMAQYYHISYRGRISTPALSFFDLLGKPELFASLVNRAPAQAQIDAVLARGGTFDNFTPFRPEGPKTLADVQAIADDRTQNLARTIAEGLDLSAGYGWDLSRGVLSVSLDGNYIFRKDNFVTSIAPADVVFNRSYAPPRFAARGSADWHQGIMTLSLGANYRAGYPDTNAPARGVGARDVPQTVTFDLVVMANTPDKPGGMLGGLAASLKVQNLFDRVGPRVYNLFAGQPDFDPANGDIRGRFVALELRKNWGAR